MKKVKIQLVNKRLLINIGEFNKKDQVVFETIAKPQIKNYESK